ncbi:MAG: DUF3810 family protein [Legionellales bacterium]
MLIVLLLTSVYYLPAHTEQYAHFIFYPLQSLRNRLFGYFPLSIGDVLYVLGGLCLLITIIRWFYYFVNFRLYKERLAGSVISTVNILTIIFLLFLLGWGVNYNKPPLRTFWELGESAPKPTAGSLSTFKQRRMKDSLALVAFDGFLVDKLNTFAPHYQALTFHIINERAKAYYRIFTDSKVKQNGLGVKPALFGYFMERMAIDGYYNPFTGEGQVNSNLPGFVLPFIICHEMAHQTGIAAEDDANLMAYTLGTMANDTSFNYSCYLNIWLYTNNRLYRRDSAVAKAFENKLNKLTVAHIDTLEQISRKYNNMMTRYSGKIYDSYLKMQDQKEGIRSYGNVAISAWQLELKRKNEPKGLIKMP